MLAANWCTCICSARHLPTRPVPAGAEADVNVGVEVAPGASSAAVPVVEGGPRGTRMSSMARCQLQTAHHTVPACMIAPQPPVACCVLLQKARQPTRQPSYLRACMPACLPTWPPAPRTCLQQEPLLGKAPHREMASQATRPPPVVVNIQVHPLSVCEDSEGLGGHGEVMDVLARHCEPVQGERGFEPRGQWTPSLVSNPLGNPTSASAPHPSSRTWTLFWQPQHMQAPSSVQPSPTLS